MLSSCILCLLLFCLSHSSLCTFIEIYLLPIQINYYSVLVFALHNVSNYYAFYLTKQCFDSVHYRKMLKVLIKSDCIPTCFVSGHHCRQGKLRL